MFAPPLYKVRKFPLKLLIDSDFYLEDSDELDQYLINQQDNMLFRQIRLITGNSDKRNDYIIFVKDNAGSNVFVDHAPTTGNEKNSITLSFEVAPKTSETFKIYILGLA